MRFQESEMVELKAEVTDEIKKEIVAFANGDGGKLYIGVADDGTVLGLDDADGVALQVSNMARDAIKPDVTMFLRYETLNVEGRSVVAVDIQQGTERPYYIARKGLRPEGVFVRQGYSSVPATDTAIRRMIKETDGDSFENMRSLEQELTFQAAQAEFSQRDIPFGPSQMKTLGLATHDGVYTNLGLLLSDQCVHTIKAAVFSGTGQGDFQDRREFAGSLFAQMHAAYAFVDMHNQLHSTFAGLKRIDRRDYPEAALREALLNLIVHREYAFRASSFISVYADRVEFTSIGGLVRGITLSDAMMGISVCRNAKLANVFYRLELIEAYGTGLRKIVEAYAGTGAQPRFETTDNAFKVTLPNLNAPGAEEGAHVAPSGDAQEEALRSLAREQGTFTRKDVEKALGLSQSASGRLVKKLIEEGRAVSIGSGKGRRYRLVEGK